jgi:hypothetical protein
MRQQVAPRVRGARCQVLDAQWLDLALALGVFCAPTWNGDWSHPTGFRGETNPRRRVSHQTTGLRVIPEE